MKKYFYKKGFEKLGPFSLEELKVEKLSRETLIWFQEIDQWAPLSEIEELRSLTNTIPPPINKAIPINKTYKQEQKILKKSSNKTKKIIIVTLALLFISFIAYTQVNKYLENKLYIKIAESAYDSDVDFDFYVDKFYRDIEYYGMKPKKPFKKIIKFAKLDQIDNATHIHGLSFGYEDDDKIEIYINPSTWNVFNKQMRYYLMYHELAHDVLNQDDLEYISKNEGKLMFPAISTYEKKTMDDFIESSHALFEEVGDFQGF